MVAAEDLYDYQRGLEVAAEGKSGKEIARAVGCSHRQLNYLLRENASFARAMDQARAIGYQVIADDVLTSHEDESLARDPQLLRVVSDNRKWYLSKLYPAVYGDRITIREEHVDLKGALAEAKTRVINATALPAVIDPFE